MNLNLAQAVAPATGLDWSAIGVVLLKYGVVFVIILAAAWALKNAVTTFQDEEERSNRPFWVIRLGGLMAAGIAAAPLLAIKTDPWDDAFFWLGLGGAGVLVLLLVLELLYELLVTRKLPNRDSVRNATMPQAIMLFGLLIASGLVVGMTLPSPDDTVSFGKQLEIMAVFCGSGLGLILAVWLIFGNIPIFRTDINGVIRRVGLNKFNRHNQAEAGAIILSSIIIGAGWLLQNALDGPFQGYSTGLQEMFRQFLITLVIMLIALVVADVWLLRNQSIVDVVVENKIWSAITLAGVIITLAYAGNWVLF